MKYDTCQQQQSQHNSTSFFATQPKSNSFFASTIQRQCAKCEQEDSIQRQQMPEEENPIQMMPLMRKSESGGYQASPKLTSQLSQSKGGGSSLPTPTRSYMNKAFGTDFSHVRVHTGSQAQEMSQGIQAKAFTRGSDIYFNQGEYSPESSDGKKLLAHELTHVVQQTSDFNKTRISPYRDPKAFNFGRTNTSSLKEESFNTKKDKQTKPWIEQIFIHFYKAEIDNAGDWVPKGLLFGLYNVNSANPPFTLPFSNINIPQFITFPITGGKHIEGYTDSGTFTVHRIEGVGYNDVPLSKAEGEGPNLKYAKNLNSSMSFAIFFKGGQAIHSGSLTEGSHGCIHVDWGAGADIGNTQQLQLLNHHTVKGLTKVIVSYNPAILPKLCCERMSHKKQKHGNGVNPCQTIKAESC